MSFDETILLKIKREFTHDEAVMLLSKELSAAKFRIGELESEVAELTYEGFKTAKAWRRDDYIKELVGVHKKTQQRKHEAVREATKWQTRYFSLLAIVKKEAPHLLNSDKNPEASVATEVDSNSKAN